MRLDLEGFAGIVYIDQPWKEGRGEYIHAHTHVSIKSKVILLSLESSPPHNTLIMLKR